MATAHVSPAAAAALMRRGGVVAYPTEAVWGLGCDPFNERAVQRILAIKRRPAAKGMIVIAASLSQALPWLAWETLDPARRQDILASWPGPNTWLVPCRVQVPTWLRGEHDTLAVRVTAHPVATALCEAFGGPVVSTSANRAGAPPAHDASALDPDLVSDLDGLVCGATGGADNPSLIRDARTGTVIRPA